MDRHAQALFAGFFAVVASGCERGREHVVIAPSSQREVFPMTSGTPHGSEIAALAVNERGDAAISSDHSGGTRLWPTLDGTRQAVVIDVVPAQQLALATRGSELIAAIVDPAGSMRILRIARNGHVTARAPAAGEIRVKQVVAAGADLLVHRADQSIERYDADGMLRGKIAARPGERVGTIAVRGGAALATIVGDSANAAMTARWIDLGDELAWGQDLALPTPVMPEVLALSPDRTRLAVAEGKLADETGTGQLAVFTLSADAASAHFFAMPAIDVAPGASVGFVDESHVAIMGSTTQWWSPATVVDPSASEAGKQEVPRRFRRFVTPNPPGAIADGIAVSTQAAGLALATADKTTYLGWGELALGELEPIGDELAFGPFELRTLWLDRDLHAVRSFELGKVSSSPFAGTALGAIAVGPHHVVTQSIAEGSYVLQLVDTDQPAKPVQIGALQAVTRFEYDAATHVLAVANENQISRFTLDLAAMKATKEAPLPFRGSVSMLRVLDPARANGAIAIAAGYAGEDDESQTAVTYFRDGTRRREALHGYAIAIDDRGTLYVRDDATLRMHKDGKDGAKLPGDDSSGSVAVTTTGDIALVRKNGVVVVDANGHERWARSLWGAQAVTYTADARRLFARTTTGMVALDAATGQSVARACGWSFGLHEALTAMTYGNSTLCEDGEP